MQNLPRQIEELIRSKSSSATARAFSSLFPAAWIPWCCWRCSIASPPPTAGLSPWRTSIISCAASRPTPTNDSSATPQNPSACRWSLGSDPSKNTPRRRGWSLEMAARELRHSFLAAAARKCGASSVASAHHADDQVEIFFLRLLRGAGSRGWAEWTGSVPRLPIQASYSFVPCWIVPKPNWRNLPKSTASRFRKTQPMPPWTSCATACAMNCFPCCGTNINRPWTVASCG